MNDAHAAPHFDAPSPLPVPHLVVPSDGLRLLLEAHDCARELGLDQWQLAVGLRALGQAGLAGTHLRWLLARGYAAQQVEQSRPRDRQRRFRPVANLSLSEAACFVLTESGMAYARARLREGTDGARGLVPSWDEARRELRLGPTVVKRFKQPAANQERVLSAFEEEDWPPRIDDPLPPRPGQDAKRRLHSTISNLNRGQEARLVHFAGGGDGQSVAWRPLAGEQCGEDGAKTERGW